MAHTVLLKRSSTASSTPSAGQLSAGELAINTVDETIFFKNNGGTVKKLSAMSDLTSNLVTISTTQTITGLKTFTEHMTLGGKKEFRLADSDSSNYVALTASTTLANNNTYTLPTAVGAANQVLAIDVVTGNDATLKWYTVTGGGGGGSPGGSDTQVQFNSSGSFAGDAGLTYNSTSDTLTIAGDLAVNGGDITTTSSTFNIAANASTVNFATSSVTAQNFTLGSNVTGSTFNLFGGNAMVATYTQSKVASSLYCGISQTDSGFFSTVSGGSMGFGCVGITRLGDWNAGGNSNVIEVNDSSGTITFYADGANSYVFPTTRGSNGQVLTTNGSGTLTWNTPSGGDPMPSEILNMYSLGIV